MPQDANHLIWIDMEMTGLQPATDRIIEVALIVTDANLVTVAEAPVWVLHQEDAVLAGMDSWNQGTHGRTGLNHIIMGSVAEKVVARAICPVLVVPEHSGAHG